MTKDRLQIEKRLLLSQKRESLGLLAGGVARDFDNIINHILGSASLGRTLAETESTIDSCLASIEDHGLRAAALCRQMLAYSGHTEAQSGLASPNLIVLDVLSAIDPACQRRIHIRKDLANGIPVVEVDMDQMRQAITGIVQNAIEAIGNHQPGMLEIITRPAQDGAEITIRDSGCGMDTAVRDRIFNPFFSTKMSGRGLGLTLSQSIIEAHGGSIQVDSIPAKGTTVRITLPARLPRPEPQAPSPKMAESTASGHVLIVHGGRPSGHATALAFAQLGFDTDECASVDQALRMSLSYPGKFRLVAVEPTARGAEARPSSASPRRPILPRHPPHRQRTLPVRDPPLRRRRPRRPPPRRTLRHRPPPRRHHRPLRYTRVLRPLRAARNASPTCAATSAAARCRK